MDPEGGAMSDALTVEIEPIFVRDEDAHPWPEFVRTGRSRLVIEGDEALIAVLHEQALRAAEHLEELAAVKV
jgi:hypothetical protein